MTGTERHLDKIADQISDTILDALLREAPDPSKADRSAAYAMRWSAKNAVAANPASGREVQVAYAMGKTGPMNPFLGSFATDNVPVDRVQTATRVVSLRPVAIVHDLDLLHPVYAQTASYGNFGRELPDFAWKRPDRVNTLRESAWL